MNIGRARVRGGGDVGPGTKVPLPRRPGAADTPSALTPASPRQEKSMFTLLTRSAVAAVAVAALPPASSALAAGSGTGADLQVSGSASAGSPNPGAPLAYPFQIRNSGPDTATSVSFTDALPAGTTFQAAGGNGFTARCSLPGQAGPHCSGTLPQGRQA